jgi:cytochrome b561
MLLPNSRIMTLREATMTNASTATRYSSPAQLFHWATVLLVLAAWTLGTFADDLPKGSIRHLGVFIHMMLGEAVMLLLILRLVWRFVTPAPAPDPAIGRLATLAARSVHVLIYVLLLAVPAVGVVMHFHGGDPLSIFGLFDIASPWPKNRDLMHEWKEIHEFLANLLLVLAALHASAGLVHHYVFKDRALKRMLPALIAGE